MNASAAGRNPRRNYRTLPIREAEAIVARFEERLNAVQRRRPPAKDWVRDAVHRRGSGRCPARLKRLSLDVIVRYGDALADLFCEYPDDLVAVVPYEMTIGPQTLGQEPHVDAVEVFLRGGQWADEWGTRWAHAADGLGACPVGYPLDAWSELDDYLAHRMPDARSPQRLQRAATVLEMHKATKYCIGVIDLALFERLHLLRGFERLFVDLYANPDEVHRLMDAIQAYLIDLVRAWARIGADALLISDDWGSQTALLVSPSMWRQTFKPYYATLFDETHRLGMDVHFHSCGNVMGIVGDLIDIGLDVLDPVQPGAMDVERVAEEFGGRVSFSGAIDIQHLLRDGSPSQIKASLSRLLERLGKRFGGGLLIGPSNSVGPDVPLENLEAMCQACHEV